MKVKHIYYFSSYNKTGVSVRYRGVYFLKELYEDYGITSTFVYPGYGIIEIENFILTFLKALFRNRNTTIVIFQKLYTKGIYTCLLKILLKIRPKGTVYDTDDADYLRYFDRNIFFFMKNCQLCTVGSNALKMFSGKYNKHVILLTSPIIKHNHVKQKRNKLLHIGWIGDYGLNQGFTSEFSHKISLNQILFPVLKEIDLQLQLTILGIRNLNDKKEIQDYFKDADNIILKISAR